MRIYNHSTYLYFLILKNEKKGVMKKTGG